MIGTGTMPHGSPPVGALQPGSSATGRRL